MKYWSNMVEGVAAQLYLQNGGAVWWSCLNEDIQCQWRAAAKGLLERGLIAGLQAWMLESPREMGFPRRAARYRTNRRQTGRHERRSPG